MKDFTKRKEFWQRLEKFIKEVKVNDQMSDEEKEMILYNCKMKINEQKGNI